MPRRTPRPVLLTPRPSDLLALGGFDGIEHVVAFESGPPAQAVARALGVRLSRWAGEGRRRAVISGADVVALASAPEIAAGTDVLAYANDARLEHALAARGARLLGPSASLYQRLGDKAAMRVAFAAHGSPCRTGSQRERPSGSPMPHGGSVCRSSRRRAVAAWAAAPGSCMTPRRCRPRLRPRTPAAAS